MTPSQEDVQAILEQNRRLLTEQHELRRHNAELGVEVKALRLQSEQFERRLAALEQATKLTETPCPSESVPSAYSSPIAAQGLPLPEPADASPKPARNCEQVPSLGEPAIRPNEQSSENASIEASVIAQDQPQQSEPEALPDASSWEVDSERFAMYRQAFSRLDDKGSNQLRPEQIRIMFDKAALPESEMALVWGLADIGCKGYLNFGDFVCAMYVTFRRTKQGVAVPAKLPDELIASVVEHLNSNSRP